MDEDEEKKAADVEERLRGPNILDPDHRAYWVAPPAVSSGGGHPEGDSLPEDFWEQTPFFGDANKTESFTGKDFFANKKQKDEFKGDLMVPLIQMIGEAKISMRRETDTNERSRSCT